MKMKMKSPKKQSCGHQGTCDGNKCNPFMACALGNFYTIERIFSESLLFPNWNQKIQPENDNRLATNLSECWHPPESMSGPNS